MSRVLITVERDGKGNAVCYHDDMPLTPEEARGLARCLITAADAVDIYWKTHAVKARKAQNG